MAIYIISYDISDDKRRNKVAKELEGYGERKQYSVFECDISASDHNKLWKQLSKLVDHNSDSVLSYPICKSCAGKSKQLGIKLAIFSKVDYYIV